MTSMTSDSEFQIPSCFIEQKQKHIKDQINPNQLNTYQKSFINDLYQKSLPNNYNFASYKPSKTSQNPSKPTKRKSRTEPSQQPQRVQKIKKLIRSSNIKEKLVLDIMNKTESSKIHRQKNRINYRLAKGQNLQTSKDNFEYIEIINVQKQLKPPTQLKPITYIDRSKLNYNDHRNRTDVVKPQDPQIIEVRDPNKASTLVPFGQTPLDKTNILSLNKSIYDKNTYRFNVMWWEKDKLTDQQRKKLLFFSATDNHEGQLLHPQIIKQLKKNLKPLRRHKLISTKYAPLAQFMPNPQGTLQSDGIQNGRMIETSSEDDIELYQQYDQKLYQETNPQGAVNLQPPEPKRKRKSKNTKQKESESMRQFKNSKRDNKKVQYTFENHEIGNKLKRALRKMNDNDWEEDKVFGRGNQQDRPIELE